MDKNKMTDLERKVLELRFGIGTGYPTPLEKIANDFFISIGRVRFLETSALRKMKRKVKI